MSGFDDGVMVGEAKMKATVLFREAEIDERVQTLAQEIAADYAPKGGLHTVTVLNGALHFASALRFAVSKADPDLGFKMTSDTIHLASYHGTESTNEVKKISDLTHSVEGKHVLIVEDIVDTGKTLSVLVAELLAQKPASLAVVVLLRKPTKLAVQAEALGEKMYVGFDIGPEFVVGHCFDYDGRFRDLPDIYALSPAE
jgi:hypoxanthine phosphoribosyltransferase